MQFSCLLIFAITLAAQTEAPKTQIGRVIGEVTAKDAGGKQLTVKADGGSVYTVALDEKTRFMRVPPGEKDLKNAAKIGLDDVKVGDRVMARGTVNEDQKAVPAIAVIVMTKEDLAQKNQQEQAEWQKRGVSGEVKTVTPDLVIATRTREGVSSLTVIVPAPNARIRRYAPDSVRFSDAKPATLADIQPGDQARVLGTKNADGTRIEAEEIVVGTFRAIAGTVISVDAAKNEISLKDVDTKRPVAIMLTADVQLRKLSPMAAMMLARRLNPSFQNTVSAGPGRSGTGGAAASEAARQATPRGPGGEGGPPQGAPGGGQGGWQRGAGGPGGGGGRGPGGGNLDQMLERLPTFTLAELQPGEPLIVSTTARPGASSAHAITILSGVEPILRAAPAGSMSLGSWSLDLNMPAQ